MSDNWINLSDDVSLGSSDQIRISVSFACTPFASVDKAQLRKYMEEEPNVTSVLDVSEGWQDAVTLGLSFNCNYMVTVNPQNGVKAGDLRQAMYRAIQKANDQNVIKSDQVVVGTIEKLTHSIVPGAPEVTTAVSLGAIAIIAVVVLVLFLKID